MAAREFIDDEFAHQLLKRVLASNYTDDMSMQALDFINKMNAEYYKNVIKKGDRTALHRAKRLRRDCYARENARNRDVMSVQRDRVSSLEPVKRASDGTAYTCEASIMKGSTYTTHEDAVIDLIDLRASLPHLV